MEAGGIAVTTESSHVALKPSANCGISGRSRDVNAVFD